MSTKLVARLDGHVVGRFHGPAATHVAVIVLPRGRIQCRGWGNEAQAEAALARAARHEPELRYGAVHSTHPDEDSTERIVRRLSRAGQPMARRAPDREHRNGR